MTPVTLYHNPRCSHSRQALALLEEKGYQPKVIEYLQTPPSVAELKTILKLLNLQPRELMRKKEAVYQELSLDNPNLTDPALINALHTYPILIERPIVVIQQKACIARPAQTLLNIL